MDRSHRLFLILALLLGPSVTRATAHYAPQVCTPKEMELIAENPSSTDRTFWVQTRSGRQITEQAFAVPARASSRFPGTEFLGPSASFSVREHDGDLRFRLNCRGLVEMHSFASPRVEYKLSLRDQGAFFLRLQNLHHSAQTVVVGFLSGQGRTLHEVSLSLEKNYVSSETRLHPPAGTVRILIEGSARLSSQLLSVDGRPLKPHVDEPVQVEANAKTYFLAADGNGRESYVVPLDDPVLIAEARRIVRESLPKIVIADVEPAPGAGENRDLLASDRAPWSWRVREVIGFSDLAHQDCSGSPGLLEDTKEAWMPEVRGICFWSYHLKRELSADEVRTGKRAP